MRRFAILFAASSMLLAGCVTTNSLMKHELTVQLTSDQSPDKLEGCISTAFSGFDGVSTIRDEGRRIITVGHEGATAFAIEIIYGTPNQVIVRDAYGLQRKFRDRVSACAATGSWQA
jgi:hypothetical protein